MFPISTKISGTVYFERNFNFENHSAKIDNYFITLFN